MLLRRNLSDKIIKNNRCICSFCCHFGVKIQKILAQKLLFNHRRPKNVAINFVHCKRRRQRIVYIYSIYIYKQCLYIYKQYVYICLYIYIYINNICLYIYKQYTLPPALAVHEIYRDIFGPPMI